MKKIALLLCAALLVTTALAGCSREATSSEDGANSSSSASGPTEMPTTKDEIVAYNLKIDESAINFVQLNTPAAGTPTATIKTSAGDIKMVLFPDEAPLAVENFTALCEKGFYNGKSILEVLPGVRISAGDSEKNEAADGKTVKDEYSLNLWHFNGAVAMDNSGIPDTNGNRFYIIQNGSISDALTDEMLDGGYPEKVVNKYLKVGGVPNYDFRDTVFGQVIEGKEIVEKIAASARDEANKPKEEITITAIELSKV